MNNNNSMAIIILCSHLCVGGNIKPLEPKEWSTLASILLEKKIEPSELLDFSREDYEKILHYNKNQIERMEHLISRSASIAFEIEKLSKKGIKIVTRADKNYPNLLKKKLGKSCPPLFYYVGNIDLLNNILVGFVGSRSVGPDDIDFTKKIVRKAIANGMGVVSGGAKGIDSIASQEAIEHGGFAVEFLSDSLLRKIKNKKAISAIRNDRLLIMSVTNPNAGFNVGFAMMRNKYIYASSNGTLIVKSDYNKGGTWSGAIENLRNNWANTFCWNNQLYNGNAEIIKRGAIPIDEKWDVDLNIVQEIKSSEIEQLSIFDL